MCFLWKLKLQRIPKRAVLVASILTLIMMLFSKYVFFPLDVHLDYSRSPSRATVTQNKYEAYKNGSRETYSYPEGDALVQMFLSKHISTNSVFAFRSGESYNVFLKRLNKMKRKGKMLIRDRENSKNTTDTSLERFYRGITQFYLYDPNNDRIVQDLLRDMHTLPVTVAEKSSSGSQLKIRLTFADGSKGRFKAMRLSREAEPSPNTWHYHEFERHHAEIAGFHLDRLMGFNRAVPTVGRVLNITRDLDPMISNKRDVSYVYTSPGGNTCFVAKCSEYCGAAYPFCGHPDMLEGSISANLPLTDTLHLQFMRNPYSGSYNYAKAFWANDPNYCNRHVKNLTTSISSHRLMYLMDAYILDFLMGNVDRHTVEMFEDLGPDAYPILLDNGRGFGKSKFDDMPGLAPITQCCQIRLSTLAKLIKLYHGPDSLSNVMRESLRSDPVSPILLEPHLDALDRRLGIVIKAVSDCINNSKSWSDVVIDDEVSHRRSFPAKG